MTGLFSFRSFAAQTFVEDVGYEQAGAFPAESSDGSRVATYGAGDYSMDDIKAGLKVDRHDLINMIEWGGTVFGGDPLDNIGGSGKPPKMLANLSGSFYKLICTTVIVISGIGLMGSFIELAVRGYKAKEKVSQDILTRIAILFIVGGFAWFWDIMMDFVNFFR